MIHQKNCDLEWSQLWGNFGTQGGKGIAIDKLNNIYQTGYIMDGPFGNNDGLLIKYNSNGEQLWNTTWGTSFVDSGFDLGVDSKNYIYVVGTIDGQFGHNHKLILLKYNSFMDKLWNRTWDLMMDPRTPHIAIDLQDNIYVMTCAGDTQTDIVILKYNNNGNLLWERIWGGDESDGVHGFDMCIDSNNDIIIGGQTRSLIIGQSEGFIAKYQSSGNYLWNTSWGGPGIDGVRAIGIDTENNIYIAGYTDSFGTGSQNVFLAKCDDLGTPIWNKTWAGIGGATCRDLVLGLYGNIYLTGKTYDGSQELMFLLKYNRDGKLICEKTLGPQQLLMNEGWGITKDLLNNIYISGCREHYLGIMVVLLKYSMLRPDSVMIHSYDVFLLISVTFTITLIKIIKFIKKIRK